jgi:glucan biosynthesis protein C
MTANPIVNPSAAGAGEEAARRGAVPLRRWDLDWLRVLAVLLLVPFHSALVFMPDPGLVAYVKDSAPSAGLAAQGMGLMKGFMDRWLLELLFFIAGAASWFALGSRSGGVFLVERIKRLLLPFLFGLVALVPLMIAVRWLGQPDAPSLGQIYARFFTEGPTDLTGMDGHLTPAHLWFIFYLFLFSLLGLPVLLLARTRPSQRALSWLSSLRGVVYLGFVPLALARMANLLGMGDKDPLYYFLVFLAGYALTSQPRFQAFIACHLWLSVALALAATLSTQMGPLAAPSGPTAQLARNLLYKASQWTWVLAILAAGRRWLNHDSPLLHYANEAAYPFYILHLPVDTLVAYFVVRLNAGVGLKFVLLVIATTALTLAIYDLVVKRVGVLRFLFGLKPAAPAAASPGRPGGS